MSDSERPSESTGERITESDSTAQSQSASSYLLLGNDLSDDEKVDAIMAQIRNDAFAEQ